MGESAVNTKTDRRMRSKTATSSGDLESAESVIADGLRTFVDVGRALARIRDGQLYKERGFKTFEAYCRQRWEYGKSHAYRLIESADLAENLSPKGDGFALLETHVRPLLKLPEADRSRVWEMAVETAPDGKITAKHVARLVTEHINGASADTRVEHARQQDDAKTVEASLLTMVANSLGTVARRWPGDVRRLAAELRRFADKLERRAQED